jgi:ATP-dependent DNA ligase
MSDWVRRSGIQLAYPFEEKRLLKWKPPWIIQPKLDGDRCRAIFDEKGEVTLLSSEAHDITANVPHIKDQLEHSGLISCELDGELYIHGRSQAKLNGIVSSARKDLHRDFEQVTYQVFDLIQAAPQSTRLAVTSFLYKNYLQDLPKIKRVPFYLISELDDVYNSLNLFTNQGYEGFILREQNAYYKRARSIFMMKFKPGREDIYPILGVKEAIFKEGIPKGMIGSFICSSPPKPETFSIGAGRLTHEERIELWKIKDLLPGNNLLVSYQHLTSKNGVPRSGVAMEILWNT